MIKVDAAIIGGTGIGGVLATWEGKRTEVETEFGAITGTVVERNRLRLLALQRHSGGHKTPPHLVNYRAMAAGLKLLDVKACVSSAAVGSLRTEWSPGTLAVCTDMVDFTFRRLTMFEDTVVHTDFSTPFPLARAMQASGQQLGMTFEPQAVYFGLDGPRYETPAEIRMLQTLGGDVVGMTASSEAIVMREAGVPYGCLAVVTNLGCGLAPGKLEHGEVVDVMEQKGGAVLDILMATLERAVCDNGSFASNT